MRAPTVDEKQAEIHWLDELWQRKPLRVHLRQFGVLFAVVFSLVAAYLYYKGSSGAWIYVSMVAAVAVLIQGYKFPQTLYHAWKGWMWLGDALGVVVTPVIMFALWSIIVIPLALLLKIVGKHVMDLRYRAPVDSYWEHRDEKFHDFKLLERQF